MLESDVDCTLLNKHTVNTKMTCTQLAAVKCAYVSYKGGLVEQSSVCIH